LVGTSIQTSTNGGFIISSGQVLAQQFVLDNKALFMSITFSVAGSYVFSDTSTGDLFGSDVPFTARLTHGIGEGSIVLVEKQFTFSALPSTYYDATFSFDGPKKPLPAGTYYLVLSTVSTQNIGVLTWGTEDEILSPAGHLGSCYNADPTGYANANEAQFSPCWQPQTGPQPLQFQMTGKILP
jgi:hypothetical protein